MTPPIKFTPAWFAYIGKMGGNANTKAQRDVRKLAKKGAGRPKHNAAGKGKP